MESALAGSHLIFSQAPTGMAITALDGTIQMPNDALCELLGFGPAELIGRSISDLAQPGTVSENGAFLAQLLSRDGERASLALIFTHKSGSLVHTQLHVVSLPGLGNSAPRLLIQLVDITDYVQAEAALSRSEGKYRNLVEQSNDAIYLIHHGQFELVNWRFCDLFGVTLAEVQADDFDLMDMVAPESKAYVLSRRQRVERGDRPRQQSYEFIALSRDGTRVPVETSVSYLEYRGGLAIQGIVRDVTSRKQAEYLLLQRSAELTALADLFSALRAATSVQDVLDIVLPRATEVANGLWSNIYLFEAETQELVSVGFYPPDPNVIHLRHRIGDGLTGHVAQTGEVYLTRDLNADPHIRTTQQKQRYLAQVASCISLPLRGQEEIVGVMHIAAVEPDNFSEVEVRLLTAVAEMTSSAISRALLIETLEHRVTERTRALAEANEQLNELDKLKSKFVSDVSHELRTPVSNLRLYLDLLARGRPEKWPQYFEVLRSQVDRLTALTEDILDLSRLELRGTQVQFEAIDLEEVVRQVVLAHKPRVTVAGLTLTVETAPAPPIWAERNQIAQIVNNLLANAINYTPAGTIQVRISHKPRQPDVCLEIIDTGLGIDPEDRPYLFDRFYRGQHTGQSNIPGTGLGLAIVKEVVDIHGGRLEIESEPGAGSTVSVWLPTAPAGGTR